MDSPRAPISKQQMLKQSMPGKQPALNLLGGGCPCRKRLAMLQLQQQQQAQEPMRLQSWTQ